MRLLIVGIILFFSTLPAADLQACSVIGFDFPDAICKFDQASVFTGRVLEQGENYADIQVLEVHRGCETSTTTTIRIWDGEVINCNGPFMAPASELGAVGESVIFLAEKIDTIISPWDRIGDYRRPQQFGFKGYTPIGNGNTEFLLTTIDGEIGRFDQVGNDTEFGQITRTTSYEEYLQILSVDFCLGNQINCGSGSKLFVDYPWLSTLVNANNCNSEKVALYQQSIYFYLLVTDATGDTKMYNQDGQFYCQNSANYDCVAAYNLGSPIDTWECNATNGGGCLYAETIRLNPCDPQIIETALYEYNGNNYVVTIPDPSLLDAGPTVRNCADGSTFCTVSPFFDSPECNDFFQRATEIEVLASRADCSTCSEISVGGGVREIFISNLRTAASPLEAIEIQSVQYINKATRVGQGAQLCPQSICSIQPGDAIAIPVEFDNGNNEFEVRVTFKDGLTCLYNVTLVEVEDCICTTVYLPVCGVDGNTYSNACRADCAGVAIASEGECGNNHPPMFTTYPWLLDLVDPNNCSIDGITVYQQGIYSYLLVTDKEGGAILYNQDGQFYCQNASNYDCVAAYNLTGNLTDSWICNSGQNCAQVVVCGVDGKLYPTPCAAAEAGVEASPDLSPCQQNMDCNQFRGIVLQNACGNLLIRVEEERISPTFAAGLTLPQPGSIIEFNFTQAEEISTISCEGKITQVALGTVECFTVVDGIICTQVPVCGVDGRTYGNACAAIIADVEIDQTGAACNLTDQCTITLSSRNCRKIGIYDEADNLLTTLDPGFVPAITVPLEIWQDPNPLTGGTTRTYIFKEGNFEVGRQTASCDNTNIDVILNYPSGCSDAAGLHILTNAGCRDLNLFGTSGQLLDTASPGETLRLGSNTIHILMAGSDTLGVEVAFGFMERDVDTGGCGGSNDAIFNDYPWLSDLVNPTNCSTEKIEVYQQSIYNYLLVTDASGASTLYNQDGLFYCNHTASYDCVAVYNLGAPIDNWTCSGAEDTCPEEDCNLTTLPEEFGLFTIIYSVCEGDTLTVPNPLRTFLCNNASGPAPPIGTLPPVDVIPQVINTRPRWESNGENDFMDAGNTIRFFPKETTEYIGYWQAAACSGGTQLPLGRPVHYLVIVNQGTACQTTESPTFLIEACVGEVVTIPSPVVPSANSINSCPGNRQLVGGTTAELAEPIFPFKKDLQIRILNEGNFQVEAMGGSGNYSSEDDKISCPELTYNFQVRLLDCPDFCAGVLPDPVCGVDGNTYSSACEAERAGVAIAAQGECDLVGGSCSNIVVNLQDGQIILQEDPLAFFAIRPEISGNITVGFQLNDNSGGGFQDTQCSGAPCLLPVTIPISGGIKEVTVSFPLVGGDNCSYTLEAENACSNTGTIFFENCDNGQLFYFLQTDDGRVYDPYFDPSITYEPVAGERLKFSFVDATFPTPCSIAEKAIVLTCLEVVEDANEDCFQGDFTRATVLPSPCETGPPFLLITNTGVVLEPYFSNSNFTLKAGQYVRFESRALRIPTLCTFASQPIAIECIEETQVYTPSNACNQFTGEVQIGTCNDGSEAVFIQVSPVDRFLVYLTDGVTFNFVDGQRVKFDYNGGQRFNTPCANSTRAGFITCIEAIETVDEGAIGEEQFDAYPFLQDAINQYGCASVEIYDQGSYDFVFLRFGPTSGRMYLDNGTFYCASTATYDCIRAYGLGNPTTSFTCSNFDTTESEDRAKQFQPIGLTVYPNPTQGELTVQLPSTSKDGYQLYLHDLFGRTVHQEATTPNATSVNINMTNYENGVYYIEVRAAGLRGMQKVVKQGLE